MAREPGGAYKRFEHYGVNTLPHSREQVINQSTGILLDYYKFDGDDAKWAAEWSVKALAFAKSKDFKEAFIGNKEVVFTHVLFQATVAANVKEAYKLNDNGYQFLIPSCSVIAFGLVNLAKTADLADRDARLAWANLTERYAPQAPTELIYLTDEFNNSVLESSTEDPDLWFIRLETIRSRLSSIGAAYAKADYKMVAHVVNKLPNKYSELITLVEGSTTTITIVDLKSKIRTFYTRKLKDSKAGNELALFLKKQFKGLCRKCGKQGHKASDCRSQEPSTPFKGVKCYNCNRYAGHLSKDCPKPRRQPKTTRFNKQSESRMFVGMANKDEETKINSDKKGYVVVHEQPFCGFISDVEQ